MENAIERHGLLHGEALGANPVDRGTRLLRLRSDRPDFDPVAAARDLIASGGVRAACPNYRIPVASTFPNDSLLSLQWHIYQPSPRADIHLPEAWDLQKGSPSTVIAIVDMGIDIGHPDLASRIWTNSAEIPGNGIDDDGNGLIDDVHGWDFGDNDNDPSPNPPESQRPPPTTSAGSPGRAGTARSWRSRGPRPTAGSPPTRWSRAWSTRPRCTRTCCP